MPIKKVTPDNQPVNKAQKEAKKKVEKDLEENRKDIVFGGEEDK